MHGRECLADVSGQWQHIFQTGGNDISQPLFTNYGKIPVKAHLCLQLWLLNHNFTAQRERERDSILRHSRTTSTSSAQQINSIALSVCCVSGLSAISSVPYLDITDQQEPKQAKKVSHTVTGCSKPCHVQYRVYPAMAVTLLLYNNPTQCFTPYEDVMFRVI